MTWNDMLLDMSRYLERYRKILQQIANAKEIEDPSILRALAKAALNEKPKKSYINTGDDVEYKYIPSDDRRFNDASK